jgi:hypothetical protein
MSLDFYHPFKYPVELPATPCEEEEDVEEIIWYFLHPEESLFDDVDLKSGSSMLKYSDK